MAQSSGSDLPEPPVTAGDDNAAEPTTTTGEDPQAVTEALSDMDRAAAHAVVQHAVSAFPTRMARMDPRDLVLLERNARFMRHEQFMQLVENVRRDGRLTSVPLAALMEGDDDPARFEVLSGNHRTRAAIEAGIQEIDVMLIDDVLTPEQRTAIQLSHNAIAGEDDPAILKPLWEEFDPIDWRDYAALDDKTLALLGDVKPMSMSEANLEFQTLTIVFLPDELERINEILGDAVATTKADQTWIAREDQHRALTEALADVAAAYDVQNVATGLDLVLAVFGAHVDDIQEGWWDSQTGVTRHHEWVPVTSVTGVYAPAKVAANVKKAIEKMQSRQPGLSRAEALDRLATQYLEPKPE